MSVLVGYIGRANNARIRLFKKGRPAETPASRAVLRFGTWCLDTAAEGHPAQIVDSGRAVDVQIGLVPGLREGQYLGRVTVYYEDDPEGIAWPREFGVIVRSWEACPSEGGAP